MSTDDQDDDKITVCLPAELPVLTPEVSRILLDILIELTKTEVLDGPAEEVTRDC